MGRGIHDMPSISNVHWIRNGFGQPEAAEIHLFDGEVTVVLSTTGWPHSEAWKKWKQRVMRLAKEMKHDALDT